MKFANQFHLYLINNNYIGVQVSYFNFFKSAQEFQVVIQTLSFYLSSQISPVPQGIFSEKLGQLSEGFLGLQICF